MNFLTVFTTNFQDDMDALIKYSITYISFFFLSKMYHENLIQINLLQL